MTEPQCSTAPDPGRGIAPELCMWSIYNTCSDQRHQRHSMLEENCTTTQALNGKSAVSSLHKSTPIINRVIPACKQSCLTGRTFKRRIYEYLEQHENNAGYYHIHPCKSTQANTPHLSVVRHSSIGTESISMKRNMMQVAGPLVDYSSLL